MVHACATCVQGNCKQPPPAYQTPATAPPLLPLKPRQCVLTIGDSALQFLGGKQWLDNVYFRLRRTRVNPAMTLLELGWDGARSLADLSAEVPVAEVYLTNITLQGELRGMATGVKSQRGGKVLAEGPAPAPSTSPAVRICA